MEPKIEEIRRRFKCPSISIGILHKGSSPFSVNFGFADAATGQKPDSETVYNTSCLTQSLTAITLSLLEQSGRISWDTPISDYLPDFQTQHGTAFDDRAVLGDLLSHCTGLAAVPLAIRGKYGAVIANTNDIPQVFNNLAPVAPAGAEWRYNEWPYALAAHLIDEVSDHGWAFCVDNVIGRLGYPRTYISHHVDGNCAQPCHMMDDGTLVAIDAAYTDHGQGLRGSGYIRTCVNDMLSWCSLIAAASCMKYPKDKGTPLAIFPVSSRHENTLTRERLLKAVQDIQQPLFRFSSVPGKMQAYGMGLYNFTLPTKFINTVSNKDSMVMHNYIMGVDSPRRKVIGNTSDLGSYTSTYWVFPETDSAVVVLSNGDSANGDATNIIAQLLTQALFNLETPIDYLAVAELASSQAIVQWQTTLEAWTGRRRSDVRARPLSAYAGDYTSPELQMTLSIKTTLGSNRANGDTGRIHANDIGRMRMCINGLKEQVFDLYSYYGDNWTFLPSSRDECLRKGYGQYIESWKSFIIKFDDFREGNENFEVMKWILDPQKGVGVFTFKRVVELPKSPSSVYSQPDSTSVLEEYLRDDSLGTSEGYSLADTDHKSGHYSDYVQ